MTDLAAPPWLMGRRRVRSLVLYVAALSSAVAGLGMLVGAVVELVDGGPDTLAMLACGVPITLVGALVWRSSVVGAVPYLATGRLTAPDLALFESISGFTTTGATVLRPISDTSQGLLMYRAITQWIGGMGVIVLVIAVLPTVGAGAMSLLQAEAPGPSGERLTPRVRHTARHLWFVYVGFTVAVVVAYVLAGMSFYDAWAHALTTVSTGGFSPHNASIAHFGTPAVEWIAIVAMFLAGGSFALYYRALRGRPGPLLQSREFRTYLTVALAASAIAYLFAGDGFSGGDHLRDSLFSMISVISTTGYATADFERWSQAVQVVVMVLFPLGAMAGSTAGGVKFVRLIAAGSWAHRSALQQLHPRLVRPVRVGEQRIDEQIAGRILGFLVLALVLVGGGAVLISMTGPDLVTSFSAAGSAFGNVGPGLGAVGPTDDYLALPWFARVVTMGQMLLGRLEIYPVILALSVVTLRRRLRTPGDQRR